MPNIPIHYGSYKNIEAIGIRSAGVALMDGYVDEAGNVNRRPGMYQLCDLGTGAGIDGLFWWNDQSKVIVISDGEVYEITDRNGSYSQLSGASTFQKLRKPTFANFGDALYSANGGRIVEILPEEGVIGSEKVTDGGFSNITKATAKGVDGITKANPGVVTFDAGHGYVDGDVIYFDSLTEMTELNTEYWKLRNNVGDTFELTTAWDTTSLNTFGYGAAETTGGNCAQKVTLTDWTAGTGWHPETDYAGALTNKALKDAGVASDLEQEMFVSAGKTYRIDYVTIVTAGTLTPQLGGVSGSVISTTGAHFDHIAPTGSENLKFQADSSFAGSVDDSTVKEYAAMAYIDDADAPTEVSHVAFLDLYLLANEVGSGRFHWSNVNAPTTWEFNFATAEVKTDNLMALDVEYMEIFLLGEQSLETWRDDGVTPFIREMQGYVASGTIAKRSLAWCNGAWVYLDHERNVIMLEGRKPKVISLPMNNYIQGFSVVSDAVGNYIVADGRPYYILNFITEGVTLVYDFISKLWYEWGYWDKKTGTYQRFLGNCFCYAEDWGMTLVGDRRTGKIHVFDADTYQDDGDEIRTLIRTGYLNHESDTVEKKSASLTLRVKRVLASPAAGEVGDLLLEDGDFFLLEDGGHLELEGISPEEGVVRESKIMVRWRDNGRHSWNRERFLDLGKTGDRESRLQLRRLGMYYNRQWEIAVTDNAQVMICSVDEDVV